MKIAVLTTFMEFVPGYSLTGIVKDQITMLLRHGHEVHLYVNQQFHGKVDYNNNDFHLHPSIPFAHLKDYRSKSELLPEHNEAADKMCQLIVTEMQDYDAILTHDFVFTGWNMPYALGIQRASSLIQKPGWFHWIHSVPSINSDWWELSKYGKRHKLVFPNSSDARQVAEQYRGFEGDVLVIPHIKDIRSWFEFTNETNEFIDAFPGVMQADIVQILPASVDRLSAKRVDKVIQIFSKLKKQGCSVCLVIANQWATGRAQKERVDTYLNIAIDMGLKPMNEVVFTSEWRSPEYDAGISKTMLRELLTCANLFIFPTREESFGLVVPEASLSSGCLVVLNKSLDMQKEISNHQALYFHFGSHHNNFEPPHGWDKYANDLASIILHRMNTCESIKTRTFFRINNNMDSLYQRHYLPAMKGSVTW